eukprot:TRINITY_DN4089_c0_g1_i2.p1 TRINITY_DN4089_c0_g1~~TRINITY_DN4089_c0_g1_i2.p1  ORF type:complete len:191 (-),score=73.29 TRINITY_DN4089_c0_g1_i2:245-817(-)
MPLIWIKERNANGEPHLDEGEEILFTQTNLSPHFNANLSSEGKGKLFVTTRNVIWLSEEDKSKGFSLDFHFISIHAISRDTQFFAHPCIYCQLDVRGGEEEEEEEEEGEEGGKEKEKVEEVVGDIRFVPDDSNTLEKLFGAFSEGAALNPDPMEEGEGDFSSMKKRWEWQQEDSLPKHRQIFSIMKIFSS